ncbi:hypothetical protein Egran_06308 [Elaphomyces granulatus]|uniref:Integrase zinc-binding domain-containing protein n=1 Tax=Elaphomyces granulatus TaxID=519963 RepID=A0A232LPA4_9EURO|nr:hypothetical protein Egran_06308 [Elaphomyces granulatus]
MGTNHDDRQRGHFGTARTLDAIRRKYFWHVHRHKEHGMLEPLPRPK